MATLKLLAILAKLVYMSRAIAFFDIDNTIYKGFSYFELLETQAAEGLIERHVLTQATACMQKYKIKRQDYETTVVLLLDIYAAGLKGVAYNAVLESTKRFYQLSDKFFSYVAPTITELKSTHDIILVTAEPQCIAQAVSELFGADSHYSTQYGVADGVFTGVVTSYLASRREKHDAIKHLVAGRAKQSFAFGDSEGDVEMLQAVEYPICLNATEGLRAIAAEKGWPMPNTNEVPRLVAELLAKP